MGLTAILTAILSKSGLLDNDVVTLAEVAGAGRCWFSFASGVCVGRLIFVSRFAFGCVVIVGLLSWLLWLWGYGLVLLCWGM